MQLFTRSFRWAVALLALLTALPSSSFAQAKIKVAIWEFENHAETHYWYSWKLGPAARDQIDTEFSENSALSSKFSVIERDKLALVLKEQGLATSGAVDPSSAAKVGKILGVKYIILGGVDKFAINNTKGGYRRVSASAAISSRRTRPSTSASSTARRPSASCRFRPTAKSRRAAASSRARA